jgi:hypothetical protein
VDSSFPLSPLPPVSPRSAGGPYGEAVGIVAAVTRGVLRATAQWLSWRLHVDRALGASLIATFAIGAASVALAALAFSLLHVARELAKQGDAS